MSLAAGIEFVARAQLGRFRARVQRTTLTIPCHGERLKTYCYSSSSSAGSILLVHGMTLRGIDDPRMETLGRAFASLGYSVYSPLFPEVADLIVTEATIGKIAQCLRWISEETDGRVGLFSASFTAGLTLIAACGDERNRVSAVCTVGTLGAVDSTLEFLLGQDGIDDYGRLVLLWNFLPLSDSVKAALKIAAADNGLERNPPELDRFVRTMSPVDCETLNHLRNDRKYRMDAWHQFAATAAFRTLRSLISPIYFVRPVPFRVVLIHGEVDNVIPPSESEKLHRAFSQQGVQCKLLVTPLISHGHGTIGLSAVPEAIKLAGAFGEFLSAV